METFEAVKRFHDRLLQLVAILRFNKNDRVDLYRVALYCTLLELSGDILHLLKDRRRTGVASLFRAFLEAAVELRNLMKDAGYSDHMVASHSDEWLKILHEAKKGENQYLVSIRASENLDEQIALHTKAVEELKARGKRPLNIFERFKRADMVAEYRSLYNFISCESHSNIRALISRHFEAVGDDLKVVLCKDEPIASSIAIIGSMGQLLIQASLSVHEALKSDGLLEVQEMREELFSLSENIVRRKQ